MSKGDKIQAIYRKAHNQAIQRFMSADTREEEKRWTRMRYWTWKKIEKNEKSRNLSIEMDRSLD